MLRQSLKKCEFNLLLNQLNNNLFTVAVQFDFKTNWDVYKEHLSSLILSRKKIPLFVLTLISRFYFFSLLKGNSLFFLNLSHENLRKLLKERNHFNILFLPLLNKEFRFCNFYYRTFILDLKKELYNMYSIIFLNLKLIRLNLFSYIYNFFYIVLLINKQS